MSAEDKRTFATTRIQGSMAALFVIAVAAVFFLIVLPGASHVAHSGALQKPLTPAEIMARLGDYDQRIPDCAGLVPGLTGYAYARPKVTGGLEVVIVCK